MDNKFWDNEEEITDIEVTEHSSYRVSLTEKDGKEYFSIRQWYNTKKDPEFKPGRQGVAIPLTKKEVLIGLRDALNQALEGDC